VPRTIIFFRNILDVDFNRNVNIQTKICPRKYEEKNKRDLQSIFTLTKNIQGNFTNLNPNSYQKLKP